MNPDYENMTAEELFNIALCDASSIANYKETDTFEKHLDMLWELLLKTGDLFYLSYFQVEFQNWFDGKYKLDVEHNEKVQNMFQSRAELAEDALVLYRNSEKNSIDGEAVLHTLRQLKAPQQLFQLQEILPSESRIIIDTVLDSRNLDCIYHVVVNSKDHVVEEFKQWAWNQMMNIICQRKIQATHLIELSKVAHQEQWLTDDMINELIDFISKNDPLQLVTLARALHNVSMEVDLEQGSERTINNAQFKALCDHVIAQDNAELASEFLLSYSSWPVTDVKGLNEIVINSDNPHAIYQAAATQSNNYNYYQALTNAIIKTGNAKYMYWFAKEVNLHTEYDKEAELAKVGLINLMTNEILETENNQENNEFIHFFAMDLVKSKFDQEKFEDELIKREAGYPLYMMLSGNPNSNVNKILNAIKGFDINSMLTCLNDLDLPEETEQEYVYLITGKIQNKLPEVLNLSL